jgi:hypothetical protein
MAMQTKQRMAGNFKIKKSVTLPVHKLKPGEERYFQFVSIMHIGKDTGQVMNGKKMEPATIADVIDLETGEMGVLICATVLHKELIDQYPNDSYVGLAFAITVIKVPEKKYNLYSIQEIEADEAQQEAGDEAGQEETTDAAPVKAPAKKGKR